MVPKPSQKLLESLYNFITIYAMGMGNHFEIVYLKVNIMSPQVCFQFCFEAHLMKDKNIFPLHTHRTHYEIGNY